MMVTQRELQQVATGVFIGRVRSIQAAHLPAHEALINWGHWSADRRGIFPSMKPPSTWSQCKRDENEEYGEVDPTRPLLTLPESLDPRKPEPYETPPYDARGAELLDARLHGYGGPSVEYRRAVRAAYVSREIPEDQFPKACGCGEDAFCERLEWVLCYVERFL